MYPTPSHKKKWISGIIYLNIDGKMSRRLASPQLRAPKRIGKYERLFPFDDLKKNITPKVGDVPH